MPWYITYKDITCKVPEYIIYKLKKGNIKVNQIVCSKTMDYFTEKLKKNYNLIPYKNDYEPVLVFGVYNLDFIEILKNHKSLVIICWCGSDINYPENEKALKVIEYFNNNNNLNILHMAMGGIIEKKIIKFIQNPYIFYPIAPTININDISPVQKGKEIYTYINASNPRVYGYVILQKLIERHPNIKFNIFINQRNREYCLKKNIDISKYKTAVTNKELFEKYKKCFLGLRLTNIDGNANTVLELGLLGIKCVYMDTKVPSAIDYEHNEIIWKKCQSEEKKNRINIAVNSISKIILEQQKYIGTIDYEIHNRMKNYINFNNIEFINY